MLKKYIFAIMVILTLVLSACAPATTAPTEAVAEEPAGEEPAAEEPAGEEPAAEEPMGEYTEAPMLADKVAAGELPPVAERLPESPFVVGPGVY
jgi:hypothetical protein